MFSIAEELENQGMEKGIAKGIAKGIEKGSVQKSREIICNTLRDSQSPETISRYTEQPIEYVYQVQRQMLQSVNEENNYETENGGKNRP